MRFHVARVEHERALQLVPLAHALDVLFPRRHAEALVVGVVDDVDLVGSDVHESQDVALRAFRHGQHPSGAPGRAPDGGARVAERQRVGQVLRKHQMDAVVNRDDRLAPDERRQHVVRCVKQRHALALERERNLQLFGDRIVAGRLGHGPQVVTEGRDRRGILRAAQHHEVGVAIEPRQLPEQIADVGADAEIVQLPRVDADAHLDMIPVGDSPLSLTAFRWRQVAAASRRGPA